MARYLGPHEMGRLSYSIAWVSIFGVVATLGLNRILVRELVMANGNEVEVEKITAQSIMLRIVMSIPIYAASLGLYVIYSDGQELLIAILSTAIIFASMDVIELHYQAKSQSKRTSKIKLAAIIVGAASKVALIKLNANVAMFAAVNLLEAVIASVGMLKLAKIKYTKHISGMIKNSKKILKEGSIEIIAGLSAILFMRMDQIMIEKYSGFAAVGIYSAASKLAEMWYFVPAALVASTFPLLIEKRKISANEYVDGIKKLMQILTLMAAIVAGVVSIISDDLIHVLYGEGYKQSSEVLVILTWCGVFICMGTTSGSWIMAEKKGKLNLYRNLAGLTTNFGLNLVLIPLYGVKGAAYATLLSISMAFLFFDIFNKDLRFMFFIKLKCLNLPASLSLIFSILSKAKSEGFAK